jgi:hypothetical protein
MHTYISYFGDIRPWERPALVQLLPGMSGGIAWIWDPSKTFEKRALPQDQKWPPGETGDG